MSMSIRTIEVTPHEGSGSKTRFNSDEEVNVDYVSEDESIASTNTERGYDSGYDEESEDEQFIPQVRVGATARNNFLGAVSNSIEQQENGHPQMPSWMQNITDKVFDLVELTNIGLGATLTLVGLGVTLLGAGTIAYQTVNVLMSSYSDSGFEFLYEHLMDTAAIPTLIVGIVLTWLGKDFAHGQEMIHHITRQVPTMITTMLFGGNSYYGGNGGYYNGGGYDNNSGGGYYGRYGNGYYGR